jgi:hypothetical protein
MVVKIDCQKCVNYDHDQDCCARYGHDHEVAAAKCADHYLLSYRPVREEETYET